MIDKLNSILSGLRIDGRCVQARKHRHMAFYDVELAPGTKIRRLESNAREIAIGLRSKTTPIIKPMPELGVVRLQMATQDAAILPLTNLLSDVTIPPPTEMLLPVLMGETDEGNVLWMDMAKNPHALIAGGTGSGKSTLLHTLIANCVVMNAIGARSIELFLIDPKMGVEFAPYEDLATIAYDYDRTIAMLEYLFEQMENRYAYMRKVGIKSIEARPGMFPYIAVFIDEVAELMAVDKENKNKRFQLLLSRLAQKARAAGIYIVAATQRPSTDVVTGLIKANFPARIACRTSSKIDSQVVLDMPGAETLLGRGDAIFKNNSREATRFQVAYSTPEHTRYLNEYLRANRVLH
jgi:S-DNA-T family DNA segregation ATPase FtsK/SpoIIIE